MGKRVVAVNEGGKRVGEDHQRAKLTNRDVELIRELHAQGWGYQRISQKFEVAKSTVQHILRGRMTRNQVPAGWKTIGV